MVGQLQMLHKVSANASSKISCFTGKNAARVVPLINKPQIMELFLVHCFLKKNVSKKIMVLRQNIIED